MFHVEKSSKVLVVNMLTELVESLERVCSQHLFAHASPQEIEETLTSWYELAYTSLQGVRSLPEIPRLAVKLPPVYPRRSCVAEPAGIERVKTERPVRYRREVLPRVPVHDSRVTPLTEREYELVTLLARSMTPKEIARQWGVSEKTVRNHLSNTCHKLGCQDKVQVVLHALRAGWVSL
jgi:LuxR family transcriptional regulator, transcriptional regulator of spore coat protein